MKTLQNPVINNTKLAIYAAIYVAASAAAIFGAIKYEQKHAPFAMKNHDTFASKAVVHANVNTFSR